jgi:hypothetical protein
MVVSSLHGLFDSGTLRTSIVIVVMVLLAAAAWHRL